MPEVIASTYEIIQRIGSGGGGVVYLANHLRLNKQVVLKADKRKITTKPELLRREVDVLKDLSHPYIPQVYDFFVEGDTVYTVMDFVDGESLDRAIKRGDRFSQAQVVVWGRQLLEALEYLHSPTHGNPPKGYVHSDIKPANIMRRMNGSICLIDFNISLALGERNVIGASPGYASPEHYGLDFSFSSETATQDGRTLDRSDTVTLTMPSLKAASHRKTVIPDVRSDIYSTGATLYHLLSGRRPDRDATRVEPLSGSGISRQVADIIAKAMNPNPDLRYQSAEEMRRALDGLHENDPRTRRLKRRTRTTAAVLSALFLVGSVATFVGLRQREQAQQAARLEAEAAQAKAEKAEEAERRAKELEQAEREALAAVRDSEQRYRSGDIPGAVDAALAGLSGQTRYLAQAQKALTDALGVYDLSDGFHPDQTLTLPSEPLRLVLSPNGTRLGAVTAFQADIIDLNSGKTLAQLPMEPSALSQLVFLDENQLIYAGEKGLTVYDLTSGAAAWTGEAATGLALSGNGEWVAAVYKDKDQAHIYDTVSGALIQTIPFQGRRQAVLPNDIFADAENDLLVLDATGSRLAVSFSDGSLVLFDLAGGGEMELYRASSDSRYEGGFYENYFIFSNWDGSEAACAVVDTAQMEQTTRFSATTPFHVQADTRGIFLSLDNLMVRLDPAADEQMELAYAENDIRLFSTQGKYSVTASKENTCAFYDGGARKLAELELEEPCDFLEISGSYAIIGSRNTSSVRLLKLEDRRDADLFSYDPSYFHTEARLSADGSRVMLFSYTGFCLYSIDGSLIAQVELPDAEEIYDQQFRREEGASYLEVFYNDGTVLTYSAQDGSLLNERTIEKPSEDLYEEFFTDHLRITSPLHGMPVAYDRHTGEMVSELEEDAYLTYVTQVGDSIITEYVTSQGDRYGLLLDGSCQVLARLPNLCDIIGDTLVFDYPSGNLRQCRIYSLQELISLAE